jgi:splicing factor 1
MEKETGAKIAIRGKGSVKEGKSRKDGKYNIGEDEPLHVLLTADSESAIEKASKMVHDLLVPLEEGKNEHKRQQLRELAEINGTLRDRFWMNNTEEQSFDRSDVKCAICGEVSHPTSDCPLRGKGVTLPPAQQKAMNNEYEKFLAEIGEKPEPTQAQQGGQMDPYSNAPWAQQPQYQQQQQQQQVPPPWAQQAPAAAPWAPGIMPGMAAPPWNQPYPPTMPYGQVPPPWQQQQ